MSKSTRKQIERNAVDWLKDQYRARREFPTTMDLREALLPIVDLPRARFSVGEAARIDRMTRHEGSREPDFPAVTIPVNGNRFLRSADATPDALYDSVQRRAGSLATQSTNLAAIAAKHAAQPNSMLKQKEAAMRIRVSADMMQSVATIEEEITQAS